MTESDPEELLHSEAVLLRLVQAALEGLEDVAAGRVLDEAALDDVLGRSASRLAARTAPRPSTS